MFGFDSLTLTVLNVALQRADALMLSPLSTDRTQNRYVMAEFGRSSDRPGAADAGTVA
jgi:hypothetical protein